MAVSKIEKTTDTTIHFQTNLVSFNSGVGWIPITGATKEPVATCTLVETVTSDLSISSVYCGNWRDGRIEAYLNNSITVNKYVMTIWK